VNTIMFPMGAQMFLSVKFPESEHSQISAKIRE